MAEEKKPKIDLKARLGKTTTAAGTVPAPAASGAIPVPTPSAAAPIPLPSAPGSGAPLPGTPIGPPPGFVPPSKSALDPSNPLVQAATPYRAPDPPPPPQAQRIEVDEASIQEASKGALKKGIAIGAVMAVIFGIVGYVAGMSGEANSGRKRAQNDARSLAADVTKSKDTLDKIAKKLEEGKKALLQDKKFPDKLAGELGGMNVDFDGGKLAGVRFSGFSTDTTSGLIEYITAVQSLNDRKLVIINLLNSLQKPIVEGFTQSASPSIGFVVLLGRQDAQKNFYGILAPLEAPLPIKPEAIVIPDKVKAIDVTSGSKVEVPKYTSGDLSSLKNGGAVYIAPASVTKNFPSEVSGKIAQLVSQLAKVSNDVNGDKADPNMVQETKEGLLQRADKLTAALTKVADGN